MIIDTKRFLKPDPTLLVQSFMKMLTIRAKILLSFCILLITMVLQFSYSVTIENQKQLLLTQAKNVQKTSIQLSNMSIDGQKMRRYEKEYFIYVNNDIKRQEYFNNWKKAELDLKIDLKNIQNVLNDEWFEKDRKSSKVWEKALRKYSVAMHKLNQHVLDGSIKNTFDANNNIQEGKNAFRAFLNGTKESFNEKFSTSNNLLDKYNILTKNSNTIFWIIFAINILLAIVLAGLINQNINTQLKILTESIDAITSGNLQKSTVKPNSPELAKVANRIERLRSSTQILLEDTNNKIKELKKLKNQHN